MRMQRRTEAVRISDNIKGRAEEAQRRQESGELDHLTCKHIVEKRAVELLREKGGGHVMCEKCKTLLPVTAQRRVMPDGSIL